MTNEGDIKDKLLTCVTIILKFMFTRMEASDRQRTYAYVKDNSYDVAVLKPRTGIVGHVLHYLSTPYSLFIRQYATIY